MLVEKISSIRDGEMIDFLFYFHRNYNFNETADFEEKNPLILSSKTPKTWKHHASMIKNKTLGLEQLGSIGAIWIELTLFRLRWRDDWFLFALRPGRNLISYC